MMKKKLYMMITKDRFELPLGVYESLDELSEKQQIPKATIKTSLSLYEHGKNKHFVPFRKVYVEE